MHAFIIFITLLLPNNQYQVKTQPFTGTLGQCRANEAYIRTNLTMDGIRVISARCSPTTAG